MKEVLEHVWCWYFRGVRNNLFKRYVPNFKGSFLSMHFIPYIVMQKTFFLCAHRNGSYLNRLGCFLYGQPLSTKDPDFLFFHWCLCRFSPFSRFEKTKNEQVFATFYFFSSGEVPKQGCQIFDSENLDQLIKVILVNNVYNCTFCIDPNQMIMI